MKIGLDYIACVGTGGNAVYSRNLIDNLIKLDNGNTYYLYAFAHDVFLGRLARYSKSKNVRIRPVFWSALKLPLPKALMNFVNKLSFSFWTLVDGLDVFHFTNPLNFRNSFQKKTVTTIHDMSPFHSNEWSKPKSIAFFKDFAKEIISDSTALISVSEYTKNDIIKLFSTDQKKVTVIYEGVSRDFYPDFDPSFLMEKFQLSDYLFYEGQLQPRKNILNLLKAYKTLDVNVRQKYPLVLVGGMRDKTYGSLVSSTIDELDIKSQVKILGQLPNSDIRKLYSGARVFVFPSLFEGFGLPILESLQCGTPVITSSTSSLPEVAGDAGILVDPLDIIEIGNAMKSLLTNDQLYKDLKGECEKQAARFSWQKAARETARVYENCRYSLKS